MKKAFIIFGIVLTVVIVLTYWSMSSTNETFRTCQILGFDDVVKINFRNHDSVLVAASTLYEGGDLKKFMQGQQYREAWATQVKVPIVFLDTLYGGLKVLEEGGGKQTHSLKLRALGGTVYTLRSISKDPEPLIPEVANVLGLENIIVDGVSAQHPYAAVVVAELAEKAEILSTHPHIVFVPEQGVLGTHNKKYGNRLYLIEYEIEGRAVWTGIKNAVEILDTEALQEFKLENPDKVAIDENSLVRARLFDLVVGDWDRHAKQWGWLIQQENGRYIAQPLPCDRDNAFFNLEGIIPTLVANQHFLPRVQKFDSEIEYLDGLVTPFDVYFLKDVPERVFLSEADSLIKKLTPSSVSESFKVWPEEIYELHGDMIIHKMLNRLKNLPEYAKNFKAILNERELLTEPLTGSEDLKLSNSQLSCFECWSD